MRTIDSNNHRGRDGELPFYMLGGLATTSVMACLAVLLLPACQPRPEHGYVNSSLLTKINAEPTVRVRIAKGVTRVRLDGPPRLSIEPRRGDHPLAARDVELNLVTPVIIDRRKGAFRVHSADGQWIIWRLPGMAIVSQSAEPIRVNGAAYPGRMVLTPVSDSDGKPANRIDVVNHVPMEQYLPGVLDKELYANWSLETFKAQAIAARSYAIDQCARNRSRHFDLSSTTASQVYGGAVAHARARSAVSRTRGFVLTFRGQVLAAFYSSCCGGIGQDAAIAFPNGPDIPPLEARHHGTTCAISPHFQWGPITRSLALLTRRFAAWGKANSHPIAGIRSIAAITVTGRNRVGRPSVYTVTGVLGQPFEINAEQLRFACNYEELGLEQLPQLSRLKSGFFEAVIEGDKVVFTGHGFGHGVGMCQWGAHALAKRGQSAGRILRFYYPGTVIERAYP